MLIIVLIGLIGLALIVAAFCIWALCKAASMEREQVELRVAAINKTYHQQLEEKYHCVLSPEETTLFASSRWDLS